MQMNKIRNRPVYEDHRVGITFGVNDKPAFGDGLYPLLKKPGHIYEVDFSNTYEGGRVRDQPRHIRMSFSATAEPHLKVVYNMDTDGVVVMQVWCDGGPSHYEFFQFNRADRPYLHYVVEPTEQAALDRYLDGVKKDCPALNLKKGHDLSRITFATGVTAIIPVQGARQLLQKL
ncbi:hypothetical protein FOL46_001197 [Perkinsus olseni]|uniref:Uncharacterized protein n=1 Tax=Perkinsus olseni TaxID=32597 RepID=A0A7J6MDZ5_PEROL|nr:hypothetical protein FOL46_001197 [Perkinsus olseni]